MKTLLGMTALLVAVAGSAGAEDFSPVPSSGQFIAPQEKPPEELPPWPVTFASDTHQFGKIAAGVIVKHEFRFTNTGDTTVILEKVEPDCDCTTVGEWTVAVEPGKSGVIPVTYVSSGYHGPIDQTIKVHSDNINRPPLVLHLKGTVWQPVELSPIKAGFLLGHDHKEKVTRSVRIRTRLGKLDLISEPVSSHKAFQVKVRTVTPGQDYYLDISTEGDLPPGLTEGEVTVKTSSENLPLVTIPVSAVVPDSVSCTPALVRLPPGKIARETAQRVIIRNNTPEPFSLTGATTDHPGTSVEIKEIRPGKLYHVFTRIPADFELGAKRMTLTIRTDHKDRPEILVPITQLKAGVMQ